MSDDINKKQDAIMSDKESNKNAMKDIVDLDLLFDESINAYTDELDVSKELYAQVKTHYDKVMDESKITYTDYKDGGKEKIKEKTTPFMAQQLTNLISLRNHISGTIKDRFSIQKEKAALTIKLTQLVGGGGDRDDSVIINQVMMNIDDVIRIDSGNSVDSSSNDDIMMNAIKSKINGKKKS